MIQIPIPDTPERPGKEFDRAVKNRIESLYPSRLPVYTVQELSALTAQLFEGYLVRCSNGNSGAECLAYCNGRRWKIIELGANISL